MRGEEARNEWMSGWEVSRLEVSGWEVSEWGEVGGKKRGEEKGKDEEKGASG